ncbi:hypothetical protein HY844_02240 [Candidatus Berkelbacteria bacterium]|nr:hypothetical protein [Candidatus Berkelbacteria bacterium]
MNIPKPNQNEIDEFRVLCLQKFGLVLTNEEATHYATKVVALACFLSWPLWKEPYLSGLSPEERSRLLHQFLTIPSSRTYSVWPIGDDLEA